MARPGAVETVLQLSPLDLVWLGDFDRNADGTVSRAEFEAGRAALERVTTEWMQINTGAADQVLPVRFTGAQFEEAETNVVLRALIPVAPGATWSFNFPRLAELPPGHRQLVTVANGRAEVIAEQLLAAQRPRLDVDWTLPGRPATDDEAPAPASTATGGPEASTPAAAVTSSPTANATSPLPAATTPSAPSLFGGFLWLGIEHILGGYDHLLFLAGLLLICHRVREIAVVITSFTVAHSITLGLATFDLVSLPGPIVEPLIAASILYVGVENIVRRDEVKGRWLLTFAFGLIHGFGFAGALRELGVGENGGSFAVPLLAFNLGVELGQLAVAALILPLLWWARKSPHFTNRILPAASGLVAAAGLFWLLQRVL